MYICLQRPERLHSGRSTPSGVSLNHAISDMPDSNSDGSSSDWHMFELRLQSSDQHILWRSTVQELTFAKRLTDIASKGRELARQYDNAPFKPDLKGPVHYGQRTQWPYNAETDAR